MLSAAKHLVFNASDCTWFDFYPLSVKLRF